SSEIVNNKNVRMGKRGHNFHFAFETVQELRIFCMVRRQNVNRHFTSQTRILGHVHVAHCSRTKRGNDLIRTQQTSRRQWHLINFAQRMLRRKKNSPRSTRRTQSKTINCYENSVYPVLLRGENQNSSLPAPKTIEVLVSLIA